MPATQRDTAEVTQGHRPTAATQRDGSSAGAEPATDSDEGSGTAADLRERGPRGGGAPPPGGARRSGTRARPLAAGFPAPRPDVTAREPASDLGKQGAPAVTDSDAGGSATLGKRPRLAGEQRYDPDADLATLRDHPRNPRRGDDDAVAGSLDANGWYGVIVAQTSTRRILAGHTRRRTLQAGGVTHAPVVWVDVDDDRAEAILLADNRTAELAAWDLDGLAAILGDRAATVSGLAGTGFTVDDLLVLSASRATGGGGDDDGDDDQGGDPPEGLWPLLAFRVPPLVLSRFRALPGADDAERLRGLVEVGAVEGGAVEVTAP